MTIHPHSTQPVWRAVAETQVSQELGLPPEVVDVLTFILETHSARRESSPEWRKRFQARTQQRHLRTAQNSLEDAIHHVNALIAAGVEGTDEVRAALEHQIPILKGVVPGKPHPPYKWIFIPTTQDLCRTLARKLGPYWPETRSPFDRASDIGELLELIDISLDPATIGNYLLPKK